MLFKFLEKPIEITAFIMSDYAWVNTYTPIAPASKYIPGWWKDLPISSNRWGINMEHQVFNTVKSCIGIIGTFQTGYILPLWCDLAVKINSDGSWATQFADLKSVLTPHSNIQIAKFYDDFLYFKLESPWRLRASKEIKFIFCDPFYINQKKPYIIPYGIPTTIDKNIFLNPFIMMEKKSTDIIIEHGTPLLHLIPLTEKPIIFKTEVISAEEYLKIGNPKISFNSGPLKMMKILRGRKNG